MRKNNNNKGFTLVELIIAMSIFTVVIGLGYGILNKINISTKNQSQVTSNQLNVNLINKYVTKDLEQCKTFQGPGNENVGSNYEFIINEDDNPIEYRISITSKGNKDYYTLTRKTKDSEIDLVVNQPKVSKKKPAFFIEEKDDNDKLFTVQVDNVKDTSGQYVFEVYSRLAEISKYPNPGDEFEEYYKTSFWINQNLLNQNNVDIGVLHPGEKDGSGVSEYKHENKNISSSTNNRYNIDMNVSLDNAGNHDNMRIDNNGYMSAGGSSFKTQNLKKTVDQLVIEVNGNTKLELISNNTFNIPNVQLGERVVLSKGIYKYSIPRWQNRLLTIKGTIIKDDINAVVNIYYGKSN